MKLLLNVSLREHTTLRVGGPAAFFVSVETLEELREAVLFAEKKELLFFVLGSGSNILFSDTGWSGLVIQMCILGINHEEEGDDVFVIAGAGVLWDTLVQETVEKKLWGLENLSAIPGTVGATPVQNVGAYGAEVSDYIVWVDAYNTKTKKVERISNADCLFSYRNSFFKTVKGKDFIITSVCFKLSKESTPDLSYRDLVNYFKDQSNMPSLLEIREAVIEIRKKKFPDLSVLGTAGSFFKNPIVSSEKMTELKQRFPTMPCFERPNGDRKISLAWILDNVLNLKGHRSGSVGVFENQPLVLVNYGDATEKEITVFVKKIQERVLYEVGINITPEVTIVN